MSTFFGASVRLTGEIFFVSLGSSLFFSSTWPRTEARVSVLHKENERASERQAQRERERKRRKKSTDRERIRYERPLVFLSLSLSLSLVITIIWLLNYWRGSWKENKRARTHTSEREREREKKIVLIQFKQRPRTARWNKILKDTINRHYFKPSLHEE